MKKLVAFAAFFAAVSFTSCNSKPADTTEVAEIEVTEPVEEEVAPAANDTTAAPAAIDSTAKEAEKTTPAE